MFLTNFKSVTGIGTGTGTVSDLFFIF